MSQKAPFSYCVTEIIMHEIRAIIVITRNGTMLLLDFWKDPLIRKIDAIPYKMLNANNKPATVRVAVWT